MNGYSIQWRMAGRRKAASLLVVLFTAVAAVFMLTYPRLIDSTRTRLEEAYDSLKVNGWLLNTSDYEDPDISGVHWYTLLDSGYFSEHATYATIQGGNIVSKESLVGKVGADADEETYLWALQTLLTAPKTALDKTAQYSDDIRAYNTLDACDDLVRMGDSIQWLDGYSADCLESDERVCLISQSFGYELGDTVPMLVQSYQETDSGIIRLKVVGVYPGSVPEFSCIMPLKTYEQMCRDAGWGFVLNSFIFTVGDNRRLAEVKQFLIENGYNGSGESGIRAAVDDRILQGTVAPIESNLALLEGLYLFFFLVLAVIGFFLCFLLARGRKPEYAIMRMLGENTAQVTLKALSEQSILCLFGIVLGVVICLAASLGKPDPLTCAGIWLCYTLGAAVAVLLTVRVNVMEILRDKE